MRVPADAPLLVVAHEGFRNGATRVLAGLLPGIVASVGVPVRVQVLTEGPLASALRATGTDVDPGEAPRAVLVNSALAADALWGLPADIGSLVYVHEEGEALATLPEDAKRALAQRARVVACVSERSRRDLAALGVDPERITIVPPMVDAAVPATDDVVAARGRYGLAERGPLVLGCGEATWRKGADLFVDLARQLGPDICCAWVGRRTRAFARQLDHDSRLVGLQDRLHWVGEVADAMPLLGAADLFVLVSRVDPQPLVPLEAAVAGTATVGFAGTGLDDLADRHGARTVPYPDVAALAATVRRELDDELDRGSLVAAAREVVAHERSSSAVMELLMPLLLAVLSSTGTRA